YSMLTLPLSDPDAALRQIETFGARKYVTGFMITCVRSLAVHHNAHMKIYRALEERGLVLSFHSAINPGEPVFRNLNRFASVHALGFPFYNILHMPSWVTNGLAERFPKLPVIWIEGGLAWVPFLMQRLDHEYMLRSSEYPLLKKKPSDYMRGMYYASQPMEADNLRALACTFEMINAETQLLYASDYPHWDFDLPSRIWDLPFLSEKAKHNILGGNAARLFKLPPRSEQQRANLERFGAVAACRVEARVTCSADRDRGIVDAITRRAGCCSLRCCSRHSVFPPQRSPSPRLKISTRAGRSIRSSATGRAAATMSPRGCWRAISAATSRPIPILWCRTCRAPAACAPPTTSTRSRPRTAPRSVCSAATCRCSDRWRTIP